MKNMTSTYLFIGLLAVLAVGLGVYRYTQPVAPPMTLPPTPTPVPAVLKPEGPLVLETPEQKIAQLLAAPVDLTASDASLAATVRWIEDTHPGFAVLFGSQVASDAAALTVASLDGYYTEYPVGISVAVDHEGGSVQRLSGTGFSKLPAWQQICRQAPGTQQDVLGRAAMELSQVGVDIVFAPVVDIATSSGVLGSRACDDPDQIFAASAEYISALQSVRVLPVLKHFPGIGAARFDTHDQFAVVDPNREQTKIFTDLLADFPQVAVMTAHVGVSSLDPDTPCSLSDSCITAVSENYPETLLFSDALEMAAAAHRPEPQPPKPLAQVAYEAVVAGNDVLVFGPENSPAELQGILQYLVQEYENSPAFASAVEKRLAKVLAYKEREGFRQ